MGVTIDGVWIGEQIYWPLTGRNYNKYNTIADFHTLHIQAANTKHFLAFSVFTRLFRVTASNNCYSSASVIKSGTELTANYRLNLAAPFPARTV
jgi:hypothetical protein